MNLEIHQEATVFDRLQAEWNSLLETSHNDIIFLTYEWQQTWWACYHPGDLFVVSARSDSGELLGIAPWFIDTSTGHRVVRTIGCVDVTDYLDLIAPEEHLPAFLAGLAALLAERATEFDTISLCNIPDGSPLLTHLPALLQDCGFDTAIEQQEVCPIITLPSTWEDYLAQLNKKQRHELRRKMRRAGEQVDWYSVGPEHNLQDEIKAFMALMAASSPDKAAFLEDEHHTAFFAAMIPRMQAAGWLQLAFLTVNGERAAAYLNFDRNKQIMVYNSGQDIERYGAISAGIVLLGFLIRHAIETQHTVFDFLRGNETYKYQMGGQDTSVYALCATRTQAQ